MGFAITSFLGTVLHFLYDWLGKSPIVAAFSGVNESTWEHMKLLFWPMLLFTVLQGFFFRDRSDFLCVKLRGILLGLTLIPVLFYTYNGVIGKSPDWLNITIFFIAAAAAYLCEAKLFDSEKPICTSVWPAVAVLVGLALSFTVFTFLTPKLGIFRDPLTGGYGIGI
jgi:hypothetical protein